MYFDDEIKLSKVTATSCEDVFHRPVVLFINFDGHISRLPAGQEVSPLEEISKMISGLIKGLDKRSAYPLDRPCPDG